MDFNGISRRMLIDAAKLAVPFACATALMCVYFHWSSTTRFEAVLSVEAQGKLHSLECAMSSAMITVFSDLNFLNALHRERQFKVKPDCTCTQTFMSFMESKPRYDQLRYLSGNGMEMFRINQDKAGGSPVLVDRASLQDKSMRYYFRDTAELWRDSVYVSRFDLNVENSEIEHPFKPMLRFAMPIFNLEEQLDYVLILNYLGENLLSLFQESSDESNVKTLLLNDKGYWIKGSTPDQEWGFMFEDGKEMSFATKYPAEWSSMASADKNVVQTDNGLFAFLTMDPAVVVDSYFSPGTGRGSEKWKIVAWVPQSVLASYSASLRFNIILAYISIVMLIVVGSFMLARQWEKNRRARLQIQEQQSSNERFVPKEFLQIMGKGSLREVELSKSVETDMAVLFSDIRSYTKLSESMSPQDVFDLLNQYFSSIDKAISGRKGFIDKYIGDAVMALFPETVEDALRAAIAMHNRIDQFNRQQEMRGNPTIHTGFGIHFGEVSLGSIGTMRRMQTTVIGDTVNLAARLESATKSFKIDILISDAIYDRLKDPSLFRLRKVDTVRVKGKDQPVTIYEAYDTDPVELAEQKDATLEYFARAHDLYVAGDFEAALELFIQCQDACPEDPLPPIYIKRCTTLKRITPGPDWTGVSTL